VTTTDDDDRAAMSAADLAVFEAARRWVPNTGARRLTDTERAAVHARIDGLADARLERARAHGERITATARRLGRQYAAGLTTERDAARRLRPLIEATDPDTSVPICIITAAEAERIASDGFAAGVAEASKKGRSR